jgi:hypothetical protein
VLTTITLRYDPEFTSPCSSVGWPLAGLAEPGHRTGPGRCPAGVRRPGQRKVAGDKLAGAGMRPERRLPPGADVLGERAPSAEPAS